MATTMRVLCGLVLACLAGGKTARGQSSKLYYGLGAGLTVPTGDFHSDVNGDGFRVGWQGMALAHLTLPNFGLRLDATYGENSANDKLKSDLTTSVGQPTDAKTKLLGADLDWTFEVRTSPSTKAYTLVGIGVYNTKLSVTSGNVTVDTSKTKINWNWGLGFAFRRRATLLFVELRYVSISQPFGMGTDVKYFPIIGGIRLGNQ